MHAQIFLDECIHDHYDYNLLLDVPFKILVYKKILKY